MHPRTALVPFALLLASLLAGCSGGGGGSDGSPTTGPSRGPDGKIVPEGMVALTYDLDAPVAATLWANDTFALQETCNFNPAPSDRCVEHITDITGNLPQGVPAEVTLDLTFESAAIDFFGFDTWIQSEESAFLRYNYTYDVGHINVKTLLVPQGSVEVVAIAYGPTTPNPEAPYSLRISITADNATTPAGVPVLVRLDGNTTVEAKTLAGNKVDILVYGPDDVYHGTYSGSHTVPESGPAGEYIVLAQQADGPIVLRTDSGDTRLGTAGLRYEYGAEEAVPPNGGYEATFATAGVPVAVGMYGYSTESPVGLAPLVSPGFTMTLTSPSGVDLDVVEGCPCITFGSGWGYGTGLGDSRVIPGTYTLTVETQFTYQITVAPFAAYFARPA